MQQLGTMQFSSVLNSDGQMS